MRAFAASSKHLIIIVVFRLLLLVFLSRKTYRLEPCLFGVGFRWRPSHFHVWSFFGLCCCFLWTFVNNIGAMLKLLRHFFVQHGNKSRRYLAKNVRFADLYHVLRFGFSEFLFSPSFQLMLPLLTIQIIFSCYFNPLWH